MNAPLPWFEPTLERVHQALAGGRLAHALLVDVPSGWGGLELVAHLCGMLLELPSGRADAARAHADLHWVAAQEVEIKVDDVRHLNAWAANRPMSAACKVAVIEQAHRMNTNAANALLKTLEEPPSDTYIVLQSAHAGRLLATVRSRCQRLPFKASAAHASAWLEQTRPDALALLDEVGGGPLDAVALADAGARPIADELRALLAEPQRDAALKAILEDDPVAWLGRWYRHVARLSQNAPRSAAAHLDFAQEILGSRRQIDASKSANTRLLLERLIYRWQRL